MVLNCEPLQKEPPEPPSKYIQEEINVDLKCSIFYVDMEGLHDGRAIKTIIPSLNPRRVVSRWDECKASQTDLSPPDYRQVATGSFGRSP
jgi:hypothetical protein